MKIGVPDRLRSGDLLHERQACWLGYTTGTEMVRVSGNAPDLGTHLPEFDLENAHYGSLEAIRGVDFA